MPRLIQAVIDSKEGHTNYYKLLTLTLLYVIKFQTVFFCDSGEINLYNLIGRPKEKQFCQFVFTFKVLSGLKPLKITAYNLTGYVGI